jgi:Na+-driven multidrug efflux pump
MHGTGDTKTPLYAVLLVNILHVVVAYPLIYGHFGFPALGVKGAAIAIAVSECLGAVFLLARSIHKGYVAASGHLEMRFTAMTVRLGYPIFIDRLLQNTGSLLFAKVILLYGTTVYAAHQVGLAIEAFSFMPGYGIAVAAATMVGQNLGAGRAQISSRLRGEPPCRPAYGCHGPGLFLFPLYIAPSFHQRP